MPTRLPACLSGGMLPTNQLTDEWMLACLRFLKSIFSGTQQTCGERMTVATGL